MNTTTATLKATAEKANAYVLRVVNAGCTKAAMLRAQAARDAAEAAYEAACKLDAFEAAFEAARYAKAEAE